MDDEITYDGAIIVYTDGSCLGNSGTQPSPGGWAAIIDYDGGFKKIVAGGEIQTTNNRMELMAVISALEDILNTIEKVPYNEYERESFSIMIYTDSQYVINGATQWYKGWVKNNWISAKGVPVLNRDLWERLLDLQRQIMVDYRKVKAHDMDELNNLCDSLAREQATKLKQEHGRKK